VPFSESYSEAKNPVSRIFWACFGGVWVRLETTNQSDYDFFNSLVPFWNGGGAERELRSLLSDGLQFLLALLNQNCRTNFPGRVYPTDA
jgi:hypothetical protein